MSPLRRATPAAILSLSIVLTPAAQAQQQTNRVDVTHCYVGETSVIESGAAYRVQGILLRGTTRANEPGGTFDNLATRCVGTTGSIAGAAQEGRGYCEWAGPGEDRALIRWTIEAGRGTGSFVGGSGRYRGLTGDITFQPIAPIPALEPGVIRVCNRTQGSFRLP